MFSGSEVVTLSIAFENNIIEIEGDKNNNTLF